MHAPTLTQRTANSGLEEAPIGCGASWIFQALPFQLSTSGVTPPAWFRFWPTAVHALVDGHDTPSSCTNEDAGAVSEPAGTGTGVD